MMKFFFLVTFFLFSILLVRAQLPDRPNVVLIMADDMGYESLSCNGSLSYKTPNIDKLWHSGVRFTNCYSQPLCTPSRVKIMTGQYNFRNYEDFGYLNPNERTIGNLMKDAGYVTCVSGKWQLNGLNRNNAGNQDVNRPYHFGFDEYCLWQLNRPKKEGERYSNPLITKNGKDLPRDNEQYGPDLFCDFIIDFIDKNSIHPFFIYYPMVLVHDPFVPTPDSPEWENKELRYKPDTAYYNDMVEYTDKIVSRIVLKLKEEGVWENTIIIFTGDNGTHPSVYSKTEHRIVRGGKGLSINTGNHVPMVVSWPTYNKKGRVYNGLLNFADFYPTLAEAAGVEKNQFKNDGESFLSIMEGSSESIKNEVFIHYSPRWGNKIHNRWVSDGIYKLYRNGSFYNTSIDLFEKNPIRKLSANEKVIKSRFRKILLEKEKESPFRKNDKIFDRVN